MASFQPLKIDELLIRDHHCLDLNDRCYYFMDYTSHAGFGYSASNDLIQNFKKPVNRKHLLEYKYKISAIDEISRMLIESLQPPPAGWLLVPIPPSKIKTNPLYDDRLIQCLQRFCQDSADMRELLISKRDMIASHESSSRPSINEIIDNLTIDERLCDDIPNNIALFDDVLTTGAHYKAAKSILESRFSVQNIIGIFIARRRILPKEEPFI